MELRREDLENKTTSAIFKNYTLVVNKLYKDYAYLEISRDSFNEIVNEEIEKSKDSYDGKESYSVYLKARIHDRIIANINSFINDDERMIKLINNYIKNNFDKNMTDDYIVYYLTRLDELFVSLNYIPNPDVILELISNSKLNETLDIYTNHNLSNKKKYHSGVTLLIDTYKEIYNPTNDYKERYKFNEADRCFDTDGLKSYFNEIASIPPLTPNEEKEYGYKMLKGDTTAKDILIKHNLKLVVNIAKKYVGSGVSLIDMIQDGNEGLITAVSKFNPDKGCLFNTYAAWWIRHYILRAVAVNRKAIRISHNSYIKLSKYYQEYNKLRSKLNHEPTENEMAEHLNITLDELKEIKSFELEVVSINVPIGSRKEDELSSILETTEVPIDEKFAMSELPRDLLRLFRKCNLTDREIKLLVLRYGLDKEDPRTLDEIGRIFGGLTRERVRQIEAKALKKIRTSECIEEFAIYMNNPDRALERIKAYRKHYKESTLNTYKAHLLNDQDELGITYNTVVRDAKNKKMIR